MMLEVGEIWQNFFAIALVFVQFETFTIDKLNARIGIKS